MQSGNKDFLIGVILQNAIEGIITNPPYSEELSGKPHNEKSLKHVKFVAVLQRLSFLESAREI
jgi:hypothetical protein